MAKSKDADPIEFTPDPGLAGSRSGAPAANETADASAAETQGNENVPGDGDDYDGTLASGSVDDKGKLTVNLKNGKTKQVEPGSFEALGNDRVRFKK